MQAVRREVQSMKMQQEITYDKLSVIVPPHVHPAKGL